MYLAGCVRLGKIVGREDGREIWRRLGYVPQGAHRAVVVGCVWAVILQGRMNKFAETWKET